ncbi:MAG: site-2 protease family protein [Candidatus Omnitrophica bacterium]|nr:site-2 protease family protein [Candidatus Omnitrophota bacterium]
MDHFFQQVLSIFILLFSVICHEFAHGYAALTQGDDTANLSGRLTLNPLVHIDPIGSLVVPILLIITRSPFIIGWAKPVPVNPLRFRDMDRGTVIVSAAGAVSNILLGLAFSIAFRIAHGNPIFLLGVTINFWLAFFNLLPIPPLDGSKILSVFLPYKWKWSYLAWEKYGMFIILGLLYTGLLGFVLSPAVNNLLKLVTGLR